MDKRQAVEFLEYLRQDRNLERTIYGDALNIAIEALKAQLTDKETTKGTTSDTISRQDALDIFDDYNVSVEMGELEAYSRDRKRSCELPAIQPVATDTNVGDKISKFIDGLEEIFADLREQHVDDSVCGLCEYDGAYMGQSGNWCNECPGFDRDDCFKLSDKTRKEWTEEIIKALSTAQPEPSIPLSWIENEIKWLKSLDSTFSEITAIQISAMVLKWKDEKNETD